MQATSESSQKIVPYIQMDDRQLELKQRSILDACYTAASQMRLGRFAAAVQRSIYPANEFTIHIACEPEWMCGCHRPTQSATKLLNSDEEASQMILGMLLMLEKQTIQNIH